MNKCQKKHCFRSYHSFIRFVVIFIVHSVLDFLFLFVVLHSVSVSCFLWRIDWTLNSELWTVGSIMNLVFHTMHDILMRLMYNGFVFYFLFLFFCFAYAQCSSSGFSYEWLESKRKDREKVMHSKANGRI